MEKGQLEELKALAEAFGPQGQWPVSLADQLSASCEALQSNAAVRIGQRRHMRRACDQSMQIPPRRSPSRRAGKPSKPASVSNNSAGTVPVENPSRPTSP